ncbi:MAG: terpene cyclase/mutase family protein [Planctomycetes bacterium]|nr:terpene cyclase/mutase family protein [Planctomycetota bacterium]
MLTLLAVLACVCQDPAPSSPAQSIATNTPTVAADDAWFSLEQKAQATAAAEKGLLWLATRQLETGCWTGYVGHKMQDDYELLPNGTLPEAQRRSGHGHLGVTALCGMAFLAGGNLPDRGTHAEVVKRVQDYVLRTARENGYLSDSGTRMYSHAFATLFLAELYGMASTDAAKATLERAVNLITDTQNAHGGWRYNPFDREIDLSVTVCQVQALRAARNIGIRVPPDNIDRAIAYVRASRVENGRYRGLFHYKIVGRGAYSKPNEYAINAAALTALSSAGIHDADLVDPVLEFLSRDYGTQADYYRTHFYYWYGNYYAAQAFYQAGGPRLRAFFGRLCTDLLEAQRPDGSWRNDTGPGDEFATAMACILLQMPKQYLPIFQR